jgi:DNA-binding NtrC family response regulator
MKDSSKKVRILVVDDSPDTLEVLKRNLKAEGYTVFAALGAVKAIKIIESSPVDLVITDLKMPEVDGLSLVRHIQENYKNMGVMMITGYPSIEGAVEAVKSGAEEYLSKPFTDEELSSAVKRSLDKLSLRRKTETLSYTPPESRQGLIGESDAMQKIWYAIEKASQSPATVLVTGESGTGKELVARAVHYSSKRSSAPFVPINCGGIPENLLESELFGYVRGAFTGATETRAGFFQTAEGGTIFLDEASETSLSMQVKLLRVLQDKEVFLVGARQSQKVDVRIIAATNKDLLTLVKKDKFRDDLFYRLNVITIDIPPLRERVEDILLMVQNFSERFAGEFEKPEPRFTENALVVLKNYDWPGNVRELENIIQRLLVMTEGNTIDVPDLPSLMRFSALRGTSPNRTLAEAETDHILSVLASVDGNKTQAAKILSITRKTLREKLKKTETPS